MHKPELVSANFVIFEDSEQNNKTSLDNGLKVVFPISVGQSYFSKRYTEALLEPVLQHCSHIKFVFSDQNGFLKHKIWGQTSTTAAKQITKAKKKNHSYISNLVKAIQTESGDKKIETDVPELNVNTWEWDNWKKESEDYIKIIKEYYKNEPSFSEKLYTVAKNYVENAYESLSEKGKNPNKKKIFDEHKQKYTEEAVNNILEELGIMLAWEEKIFKDKFNYIAYPTSESKAYDAIYKLYKCILEMRHGQEYKPNLTYLDIKFEKRELEHQNGAYHLDGSSSSSDDNEEFERKTSSDVSNPIDLSTKRRQKIGEQNRHLSAPPSLRSDQIQLLDHDAVRLSKSQPASPPKNAYSFFSDTSSSDEKRDPFVEGVIQKVITSDLDEKKMQKLAEFASFYKRSLDSKKASLDFNRATNEPNAKRALFQK